MGRLLVLAALLALAACGVSADGAHAPALDNSASNESSKADAAAPKLQPHTEATAAVSACLVQDGKPVAATRLRAVGTEPFWAADVEGRCVTYSTPEDQNGTRIWTRFDGTPEGGTWAGSVDGKPFVMTAKRQNGCSDGMSDKRYPIAVTLEVGGEQRIGCAEPR